MFLNSQRVFENPIGFVQPHKRSMSIIMDLLLGSQLLFCFCVTHLFSPLGSRPLLARKQCDVSIPEFVIGLYS
jgi:hypothetical protein